MTDPEARAFAAEWIAAWNRHDLDRILSHYAEEIEVTSPLVARVIGGSADTVRGKPALRAYWGPALQQFPDLEFKLLDVLPGVRSVVLHYRSIKDLIGAEFMEFDAAGKIRRVVAHYSPGSVTGT